MKVLAKIGLVAAAAATVVFIFVYEVYKPNSKNRTMAAAPEKETVEESQYALYPSSNSTKEPSKTQEIDDTDPISEEPLETATQEDLAEAAVIEESTEAIVPDETSVEEVIAEEVELEEPEPAEEPTVEEEEIPATQMRRIYGKITLASTGENLAGVNIMVPGSNVAKISNNIGGYTIQVPQGTRELVFIYRGKKLAQRVSSSNNLLNVRLNLETMQYD